ncbi:zinc finger and BTB domain-containing protein 40 [Gastrophryne carolinensis]
MELPNYSRQLLQQVYTLCKEQQFCDCTIFVGTLHFRAHKLILSAASLLFKSLLETTETISIDASVVSPEEFSLLLEMMYSGKLPPGKHNLTKIISVADSLQMFDVAVSCKNLLTELMKHSNQNQKVNDVAAQPVSGIKAEAKQPAVAPRSSVVSETFAIDKVLLPMNTGGTALVSAPEQREVNKVAKPSLPPKKMDANGNLQPVTPVLSDIPTDQSETLPDLRTVQGKDDCGIRPKSQQLSPAQGISAPLGETSGNGPCTTAVETIQSSSSEQQESNTQQNSEQVVEERIDITPGHAGNASDTLGENNKVPKMEENAEPAAKKRRLNDPVSEKTAGELDFLIRYESIFSEALSDPRSVLENLKKCQDIKEAEKQAVAECCQAEEGSSTFAKLLEKVKDGQSIVVETVLALLKLCRDTNPSVNEALREKEPMSRESVNEATGEAVPPGPVEEGRTLFDLLMERREELIQCITELSPIIECLDTAEEGFLTNIEKKVITDCCESGSHKEAMDKILRKASETKTLSPDSLIKLLQAVREAFPDLHTLLDLLEPHSTQTDFKGKLSTADYGTELLKQYQENLTEVVNDTSAILDVVLTSNLTDHEKELIQQLVKKNISTRFFSILTFSVFEEKALPVIAVWQVLLAMEELSPAVKSLMDEIRKEPGADVFFQSVLNRENAIAEVLVSHSSSIVQAFRQCDILSSVPPEEEALNALVKELLNIPQQTEDLDVSAKVVLNSALQHSVRVMKFCHLLSTVQEATPALLPIFKDLQQNGLLMDKCSFQNDGNWSSDCPIDAVEEVGDRNEEDEEVKDDENEEVDSEKERAELAQEKGSKKNFTCKSCDKIFLFRCRLEVHMKRCRMAKRNPLQCKDCNVVQASKKDLDQHREEVHGYQTSRNNKAKKRMFVTCDICGKEFAHPSGLQYHKRTEHFDEKPFSCEECGAKFAANSTLKNHQRLHTGERPFVCKHCHMTFTQAAALSYHTKKKHSEGKMYVCQYCDAVFAQSIELTRHVRTHTGDKPYVCRECGKGFSQANGLSIHLRTFHNIEDPYDCQKCRMSFPTLEENRQHIQVVHSKEYHPCPSCEKIFSAPSLLERHIVTHVGGKPYNCDICDKAYQQLSGLWYHNRTHHPDLFAAQNHRSSKFSAAQCSSCEQVFSNTSTLQKHTQLEHPDGKFYDCDKCKQSLPSPAALQVHIKCKHSGSQPFQCLYCSECFQFPGALQHHVATDHFNETENTFGCELCGELFTAQSQLERHYEVEHPNIVIEESDATNTQVVQVIQAQDQVTTTEQVITLDESQLAGSQVIVALPDSQTTQATTTELVAVSMEDLFDGTVTLICGDTVTGVTQRTQS